jgi:tetratricopeptide (TPR) repeat protein
MADKTKPNIFLSHTSADAAVAHAIRHAIEYLFGEGVVTISYSTSKDLEGGIRSGEDWFEWITTQVRRAHVTIVVLTPASVDKPWILWETGAVYGAAAAEDATQLRRVRPLTFGIDAGDVPAPLASMRLQNIRGDREEDVRFMLNELLQDVQPFVGVPRFLEIAQRIGDTIPRWLTQTSEALRLAPLLASEPVVQEWLSRLDDLRAEGRTSEVARLHQWMLVAFGRDRDGSERPLDLRIHGRLGDLYSSSRQYVEAAKQYRLAHKLAPRDIYTLRFLGKAYLDAGEHEKAGKVVNDIDVLDPSAAVQNDECAALKGRWLFDVGREREARDVYIRALDVNRKSYYLADLLGQLELELGDRAAAAAAYDQALKIIETLYELNQWTHATAATAAIVVGDNDAVQRHLAAIHSLRPTSGELASIERGLFTMQEKLNVSPDTFSSWIAELRGSAAEMGHADPHADARHPHADRRPSV